MPDRDHRTQSEVWNLGANGRHGCRGNRPRSSGTEGLNGFKGADRGFGTPDIQPIPAPRSEGQASTCLALSIVVAIQSIVILALALV